MGCWDTDAGMLWKDWDALGGAGTLGCTGTFWEVLGCSGVRGDTGMLGDTRMLGDAARRQDARRELRWEAEGISAGSDTSSPADCSRPSLSRPPFLPSSASMNMPHSFGSAGGLGLGADSPPPASPNGTRHPLAAVPSAAERCWPVRPTLRNELDTFSVHFYIFFGPNVSVPPDRPAVFVINLLPVLDSGGVLNLELRLNVVRTPRARFGALPGGWMWLGSFGLGRVVVGWVLWVAGEGAVAAGGVPKWLGAVSPLPPELPAW